MDGEGTRTPVRAGRLLVAAPALDDPNFAHTVVAILEHGAEGTLGVVLNRPSEIGVGEALPGWDRLASAPERLFSGGPVRPTAMLGLVRTVSASDAVDLVAPGIGVVDLDAEPIDLVGEVDGVRVFAGYAGWDAGQLDGELAAGGWYVVDAQPDDVFTDAPEALWLAVLRRQGGFFTTVPENPTMN